MHRYLVIANEAVGGDALVEEVQRRASWAAFDVAVPALVPTGVPEPGGTTAAPGGGTTTIRFADPRTGRGAEAASGTTDTSAGDVASGGRVPDTHTRAVLKQVMERLERVANEVSGEIGRADAVEVAEMFPLTSTRT